MKYKGKELKEITTPQIVDPPKQMLVWDDAVEPEVQFVYAIVRTKDGRTQAIGDRRWEHCAEIPEEPKARRATNRELAMWLAQGNGEQFEGGCVIHRHSYLPDNTNKEVGDGFIVRKWDDTDWHEPTVDYMGIEDPAQCGSKMPYFTEPDYFKGTEVKIGNQTWMNKNLDVDDVGEGIFFNKDNGEYYYTWDAAKRIADKIPGWHLPSREEWNELVEATGYDATNLKAKSWNGNDKYGFSAVPAGLWNNEFLNVDSGASFWTSEPCGRYAWSRYIDTETRVLDYYYNQCYGFSVRLVKDK